MRISIGSDHAGFALKEHVKAHLQGQGQEVADLGPDGEESVDYPRFARSVAQTIARGDADFGVLVCGTGLGMEIAANKVRGVRAVQVINPEFAHMARAHNDANVLTLAGRYTDPATADLIVDTFLATPFEGGRHSRRVGQIGEIEDDSCLD